METRLVYLAAVVAAFLGCVSLFVSGLLTRRQASGRRRRGPSARQFPNPRLLTPAGRRLYWLGAALLAASVATLLAGVARERP